MMKQCRQLIDNMNYEIGYRVKQNGVIVEDRYDEVVEISTIDQLVKDLHYRYGRDETDIEIRVWRANWNK